MLRNNSGDFYPRSPCGERPTRTPDLTTIGQFLSTLSLRRATGRWLLPERGHRISIHALLAESDGESNCAYLPGCISIHALLAESDAEAKRTTDIRPPFLSTLSLRRATACTMTTTICTVSFLSTLSLRRATRLGLLGWLRTLISIHALLAESDTWQRGSRVTYVISIHALLAESDNPPSVTPTASRNFYPRSPCGERPVTRVASTPTTVISIHALLAESDLVNTYHRIFGEGISIHALLAESDVSC